ncbi:MAG: hypothetical protein Q4F57_06500 [Weeksellaceae bacterium]|nr:hypothetical protein [Weeksellaceae bacterium]
MNFSNNEKIAMVKAMDLLIKADDEIHEKEMDFLEGILQFMEIESGYMEKIDEFTQEEAIATIQQLDQAKIDYVHNVLDALAAADSKINESETKVLEGIKKFISTHRS